MVCLVSNGWERAWKEAVFDRFKAASSRHSPTQNETVRIEDFVSRFEPGACRIQCTSANNSSMAFSPGCGRIAWRDLATSECLFCSQSTNKSLNNVLLAYFICSMHLSYNGVFMVICPSSDITIYNLIW
jgi:hypothetical protein